MYIQHKITAIAALNVIEQVTVITVMFTLWFVFIVHGIKLLLLVSSDDKFLIVSFNHIPCASQSLF